MNVTKQKQTHRNSEQISGYRWEDRKGKGQNKGRELRGINYYA